MGYKDFIIDVVDVISRGYLVPILIFVTDDKEEVISSIRSGDFFIDLLEGSIADIRSLYGMELGECYFGRR